MKKVVILLILAGAGYGGYLFAEERGWLAKGSSIKGQLDSEKSRDFREHDEKGRYDAKAP